MQTLDQINIIKRREVVRIEIVNNLGKYKQNPVQYKRKKHIVLIQQILN